MSQRERDKLKIWHEVERRHIAQQESSERLGLSVRQVRRLSARIKREGDRGIIHLSRFFEQDFIDDGLVAYTSFAGFSARPGYHLRMKPNRGGLIFVRL